MIKLPHADQKFGFITYSQQGEDLMLMNIFKILGVSKPTYLDLGAHHPHYINNTALLYESGSRGVNVEANRRLMDAFATARPRDTNVCAAVAKERGVKQFLMFDEISGRNTLNYEAVVALGRENPDMKVTQTELVNAMTLMELVELYFGGRFPELLLTDIEGSDFEVLESADFGKSRPMVICTEAPADNSLRMVNMLGYRGFFVVTRMGDNLIFADSRFAHKLRV